jgi:hypothetical protein
MFNCERCGSSFSPLRAASLGFCPRCQGRDGVAAPLSFKLFTPSSLAEEAGADSAVAEELVEPAVAEHGLGTLGDHV